MRKASKKLKQLQYMLDPTNFDSEESIKIAEIESLIEEIEELANEASKQGDVRAIHLLGRIKLSYAKKLTANDPKRELLIDEARKFYVKAALKGSGLALQDIASQEAQYLSNDSVETLAYVGLDCGKSMIETMVKAYDDKPDFTTTEDMISRAEERYAELKEQMDTDGIKLTNKQYTIYF